MLKIQGTQPLNPDAAGAVRHHVADAAAGAAEPPHRLRRGACQISLRWCQPMNRRNRTRADPLHSTLSRQGVRQLVQEAGGGPGEI